MHVEHNKYSEECTKGTIMYFKMLQLKIKKENF